MTRPDGICEWGDPEGDALHALRLLLPGELGCRTSLYGRREALYVWLKATTGSPFVSERGVDVIHPGNSYSSVVDGGAPRFLANDAESAVVQLVVMLTNPASITATVETAHVS